MQAIADRSLRPQTLSEELLTLSEGHTWHVLHTRSRQEKALAQDLSMRQIRHYLPLVRQVRYYGRRKIASELPLFSSYLFLLGTLEEAYLADRTGRVARIVPVFDQEQLDWELRNLQLALRSGRPVRLDHGLRQGARVEVRAGPLKGVQGVIDRVAAPGRLVLQVTMLGKGASLEIDESLLVPLR
jgi:transcriptional antiterminator RfaH